MAKTTPTVLIVEDEPISKVQMEKSLNALNRFNVVACDNGEDAVAYADSEPITVALLDIGLPGIDGVETARRLKSRHDASIIFITAHSDEETISNARSIDPYAIFSKPFDIAHVRDTVNSIVDTSYSDIPETLSPGFLLDTLYDTAQVGMCVTDEHRRYVRVNRAYRDTYGYLAEELIGREFTTVLPPEDREAAAEMHDRFIAGELAELPAEWRVQTKEGSIRNIHVTAGRMIGNDGKTYKVTTVTDITERVAREQELKSVAAQKDLLLQELNHRVKNNLSTLASIVNLEYSREGLGDEARSTLKSVSSRIYALARVYERLQSQKDYSSIDAAQLIYDVCEGTADAGNTHAVRVHTSVDGVGTTTLDLGVAMGLIVNELLSNSVKHAMHEGHELTVNVDVSAEHHETTVDYYLNVSDNGPGLPDDFDLETSESLGIQIVQAISARHEGAVYLVDPSRAHIRVHLRENIQENIQEQV